MISKLFQKLASLPGINWFNHKDKIAYEPGKLADTFEKLKANPTWHDLRRQNERYFTHMMNQERFIIHMMALIEQFDKEVDRWNEIQSNHEQEIASSPVAQLKRTITKRDNEIKDLKNQIKNLQTRNERPLISNLDVNKLIKRLDEIEYHQSIPSKQEKKAKLIHHQLHNFLQKIQAADGK